VGGDADAGFLRSSDSFVKLGSRVTTFDELCIRGVSFVRRFVCTGSASADRRVCNSERPHFGTFAVRGKTASNLKMRSSHPHWQVPVRHTNGEQADGDILRAGSNVFFPLTTFNAQSIPIGSTCSSG